MQIKICGITSLEDAQVAVDAGADYLGFVFAESPRRIQPRTAAAIIEWLPSHVRAVGVFVDSPLEELRRVCQDAGLHIAQLHGQELPTVARDLRPARSWKAFRVRREEDLEGVHLYREHVEAVLLDAYSSRAAGGTGESFDWRLAENASRFGIPIVLAGGLHSGNVALAVEQVRPDAVDVSSGVESSPGRKDPALIRAFVRAARGR